MSNLKAAMAKTIDLVVRSEILAEGPQMEDEDERIVYVNRQLADMSHVEFLERISNAFASIKAGVE